MHGVRCHRLIYDKTMSSIVILNKYWWIMISGMGGLDKSILSEIRILLGGHHETHHSYPHHLIAEY